MTTRRWQIGVIIAGLTFPVLIWWLVRESTVSFSSIYAYDTGTGKIFATHTFIPPMPAPSGPQAGVLAHVVIFSGESKQTVIYLKTHTPHAHDILEQTRNVTEDVVAGTLVRLPQDQDWVPINTPAGRAILERTKELAGARSWQVAIP